jgi:hypothetical protein
MRGTPPPQQHAGPSPGVTRRHVDLSSSTALRAPRHAPEPGGVIFRSSYVGVSCSMPGSETDQAARKHSTASSLPMHVAMSEYLLWAADVLCFP